MTSKKDKSLRDIGEFGLLASLQPILARHTEGLPLATGDDVAITDSPGADRLVWTIDSMIEGVHFRWYDHPLATSTRLGGKLAAVNLSDLASKGAKPIYALLSLGVPADTGLKRLDGFYKGLDRALTAAGCRLVGGDTVTAPHWTLSLAMVGTLAPSIQPAGRHLARAGQNVYITGWPGEAAAGLEMIEGHLDATAKGGRALMLRLLEPRPRLAEGQRLAVALSDLAMMDVSDGVANDAQHIADRSRVALVIEESALPVSRALASATGGRARDLLLHGGDDYELLFCTSAPLDQVSEILGPDCPVTRIGHIDTGTGVWMESSDGNLRRLERGGYQHFTARPG